MITLKRVYSGGRAAKYTVFLLGVLLFVLAAAKSGAGWYALPLCLLCAVLYIVLPGLLFARMLPKKWNLEYMKAPVCLLLGTVFLCFVYPFAVRLWRPLLSVAVLPLALVSVINEARLYRKGYGLKGLSAKIAHPVFYNLLFLLGIAFAVAGFALCLPNALPSAVGSTVIHQDILWNTGNAAALKRSFPPWDSRFLGIQLKYHFFADLIVAVFSMVSGLSCFAIYLGGIQPLLLAALVLCLYCLGMQFYKGNKNKSFLFTVLIFSASSAGVVWGLPERNDLFGNTFIYHLLTNINGQTMAALCCAVFAGLFVLALQSEKTYFWPRAALCLLAFGVFCLAKGPQAAIAACAAIVTGVYCLLGKNKSKKGLVLGLLIAVVFAASYALLYSGGAQSSMFLDIRGTLGQSVFAKYVSFEEGVQAYHWGLLAVQLLLAAPLPLFCAAYAFVKDVKANGILNIASERFFCYAAGGGGLLAFGLFTHNSYSQLYFLFVSVFFLCLPAADALPRIISSKKTPAALRAVACVLAVSTALSAAASYASYTVKGAARLGGKAQQTEMLPYTLADENAALWLKENTPQNAIFATNRIHSGPVHKGVSNFFSAISERQAHMEGFTYVQTNMGIPFDMLEDHVNANALLFSEDSTAEEILQTARERGISYLIYCEESEGSRKQLDAAFELVFEGTGTAVYKIY